MNANFVKEKIIVLNLVFLPATQPGDRQYGQIPDSIPDYPDITIYRARYQRLVWYNEAVRNEAIAQIRTWGVTPVILIGFSKSGLGAWNISRMIPEIVSGTIIFDAPMAREVRHPSGTEPFYADDTSWQKDLPLRTFGEFHKAMPKEHRLVLISGPSFHDEMRVLSQKLLQIGHNHAFLDQRAKKHHWNSGWIEQGLRMLLDRIPTGDVRKTATKNDVGEEGY